MWSHRSNPRPQTCLTCNPCFRVLRLCFVLAGFSMHWNSPGKNVKVDDLELASECQRGYEMAKSSGVKGRVDIKSRVMHCHELQFYNHDNYSRNITSIVPNNYHSSCGWIAFTIMSSFGLYWNPVLHLYRYYYLNLINEKIEALAGKMTYLRSPQQLSPVILGSKTSFPSRLWTRKLWILKQIFLAVNLRMQSKRISFSCQVGFGLLRAWATVD